MGKRHVPPLVLLLMLAACAPKPWEQAPDVQAAKHACHDLPEGECYVRREQRGGGPQSRMDRATVNRAYLQEVIMRRETWLLIIPLLCAMTACARPTEPSITTPPPTVTIVLPGGTVISGPARLDSPEKAQTLVAFPVLVPDQETLPAGLELGFVAWKPYPEQGTEIVMFAYRGDGIDVDIQQLAPSRGRMAPPRQPHERIKVRGTTGHLLSSDSGEAHGLSWEESGTMVNVSTSGLTREQTLHIVEGMEPVGE